ALEESKTALSLMENDREREIETHNRLLEHYKATEDDLLEKNKETLELARSLQQTIQMNETKHENAIEQLKNEMLQQMDHAKQAAKVQVESLSNSLSEKEGLLQSTQQELEKLRADPLSALKVDQLQKVSGRVADEELRKRGFSATILYTKMVGLEEEKRENI